MRHRLLAAALALICAACHVRHPTTDGGRWALLYPPERADPAAPKGVRLLPRAPLDEWRTQATFDSAADCEARLNADARAAVTRARDTAGDDARYDLPLRRAVSARCAPTGP